MTMGKMTIQEIAKILVEKNKLTQKEASQFAQSMFEIIQQRLDSDGLVKVKGLGTFKMIRVEARESVSVRTGERVLIDSHSKVTFTPDATMKELVNKPFSQFETVVLNEGVEFDDLKDDLTEEELAEGEAPPSSPEGEAPLSSPEGDTIEAPSGAVGGASTAEETIGEEEDPSNEEPVYDDDDEEPESHWKKTLGYCLLTLALMAASAYAGYWYGQRTADPASEEPAAVPVPEVVVNDSIEEVIADSTVTDSVTTANEPVAEPLTAPATIPQPAPVSQNEEEPFWKKYEAMDARVRTGAYHIIGTDHEVKVRQGETLSRIARRELGEGMSCYIEVYNGLKADAQLKEGQVIKVPKLKWKKSKK